MIYPLIEIVGVDAAGKTKLAEKLAERIDGKYVHLPSDEDEIERKAIRASGNLQALFHFYFGINARFTQENKRALQKHPVIVEPYFTSTMANLILSGAGMTTAPYEIMQPDFQIYLNPSNWDEIEKRLAGRKDRKEHEKIPHLRRLNQLYSVTLPKKDILIIDTTKLGIEDTLDLAEREVKRVYNLT